VKRSAEVLDSLRSALVWVFLLPLRIYSRVISPALPARCRYYPTCSAYAEEAVRTHGIIRGTGLAAWRLVRCNPFSRGGVDEVPPRGAWRAAFARSGEKRHTHDHAHGSHA
jgi:putative membrane protein insertion efficiency factor